MVVGDVLEYGDAEDLEVTDRPCGPRSHDRPLHVRNGYSSEDRDDQDNDDELHEGEAALVPPTDLRVAVWEAPESLPAYRNFPALDLAMEKAGPNSPLVHVTPDDAPALVIMGGKDELVPPKHGRWIAEAYKREKVVHKLIA